jgi:hypothetical protein
MAEIEAEVRRRRPELPARLERELDALFLEHSPLSGKGGNLDEALRQVDGAAFIDPVVPVASSKSGGAVVKKGLRALNLWYVGYVTGQVSTFAAAVSRALHLMEDRVEGLAARLPAPAAAPVLDAGGPGAWWEVAALDALAGVQGRVLHTACGDGWLVRALGGRGVDAYGVDPRPGRTDAAEFDGTDLRQEEPLTHLCAVGLSALAGLVISGVVDGMAAEERQRLLELVEDRLAPEAVLVLHSRTPAAWAADDAAPEVDLAPGRPLRPATWAHLLGGWAVEVHGDPAGAEYLLVARR